MAMKILLMQVTILGCCQPLAAWCHECMHGVVAKYPDLAAPDDIVACCIQGTAILGGKILCMQAILSTWNYLQAAVAF